MYSPGNRLFDYSHVAGFYDREMAWAGAAIHLFSILGMRRFLHGILLFILPAFAGAILLDRFLSHNLKKSNAFIAYEFSVWNDIFEGKIATDIAIYGSSRAWVHIDPQMLEDSLHRTAYNLGIDGHNFWLQHLRHTEFLKYNQPPEYIIHSIDVFSFQKRKDLFNPQQFLPYMLLDKTIMEYTISYDGYSWPDYCLPLLRYRGQEYAINEAFRIWRHPVHPHAGRKKGYMGMNYTWNDDLTKAKTQMRQYNVELDSPSIELYDRFLADCASRNIKVIMVYTPEYTEGQRFVANRAAVITLFRYLAGKYNLLFLDYSDDAICGEKEYFYNASHMNKRGAELFTGKLIGDLKRNNVFGQ